MSQVSSSSQHVQHMNKDTLSKEQEDIMRAWIITKMPSKLLPYFRTVTNIWDRNEVITACIKDLNYKDIIMYPRPNRFTDEIQYVPFFKLSSLATMFGYLKPADLFKEGRTLSTHKRYTLRDLKQEVECSRHFADYISLVIPSHLDNKSDPRNNDYIYIDLSACEALIFAAMKQSKFRKYATAFKDTLSISTEVSNAVISKLNQLVSEYRYQQHLSKSVVDQQKILAIEQKERDIEAKQKRLEEEMKIVALQKYPDVDVKKCHYGYIFSSPDDMKRDLFKIGITDNLKSREKDAHTYCPRGNFLYTVDIYDARSAEYTLHQVLKKYKLHRKINSGDEWFSIPGLEEAKGLLDIVATDTNNLYEHVSKYPAILRNRFIASDIPPMIEASPDPPVDETKLVNDFIKDVANKVGADKPIYKTHLLKILKELANDDRYKKHKDKLPTDFDRFANTTDDGINTNGIKIETKSAGRQTTIRFIIEIITTD